MEEVLIYANIHHRQMKMTKNWIDFHLRLPNTVSLFSHFKWLFLTARHRTLELRQRNIAFSDDVVAKRTKIYFKSVDADTDIFVTSDEIYHFLRQKKNVKSTDISKSFRQKYDL